MNWRAGIAANTTITSLIDVAIISEHNLKVLYALWVRIPFALESLLDNRGLPLLDLKDATFDGSGYLQGTHADETVGGNVASRLRTMKCVTTTVFAWPIR